MDTFGNDLSSGGVVLSRGELIKKRERNGECPTCGQKCFKKKLFKLEPNTVAGKVLNGRCLVCKPQDPGKGEELLASCATAAAPSGKGRRKGRAGGLSSSFGSNEAKLRSSGKRKDKLKSFKSERIGMGTVSEEPTNGSGSRARGNWDKLRNSSQGVSPKSSEKKKQNRRSSLDKQDSQRTGEFLERKTPRPSATFLGIDIKDLGSVDSDDDNSANGSNNNGNWGSVVEKISREERRALQTLSRDDNSFLDIVNIMMMNSTSMKVQAEGLHALSLVHVLDANMLEDCANSCGFEVIISAMGRCSKDAMAQTNACKVLFLAAASGDKPLQIAIGFAGGVEGAVDAMKVFEEDDIVMEGCLLALSNLCIPEENVQYALEGELIELAAAAMAKNVENCGLQEHGCAVLANLAVHEKARRRIRDCGGCDNIVVSMIVNPMDVGVQCQALVALRNLCVKDDENKVLLANAGAIDAIIQAMQNHRDEVQIQARASWVLSVIGVNEDNKLYIGENGGSECIVRSMWDYPDDLGIQEKGCRALWTLSVKTQNRDSILDVDGISAIIVAMKNHASEPDIQERGCGVLCNMAANDDDIKVQIVDEGALEAIVMAMVLHGENEGVQELAVNILYKLCIPDNRVRMIEANVGPMLAVVEVNKEKARYVMNDLE